MFLVFHYLSELKSSRYPKKLTKTMGYWKGAYYIIYLFNIYLLSISEHKNSGEVINCHGFLFQGGEGGEEVKCVGTLVLQQIHVPVCVE